MLLLVIFACYIVTINSQVCSQYYPSTCATLSTPTQTCTPDNIAYHCDESSLIETAPVNGGNPCVEYTDQCTMCARLCQLSGYSSFTSTPATEDETYVVLKCGTGVCTSSPTKSPIVPGTPTQAPTMRPTTACSRYTCDPTKAPNLNCTGQPTGVYSCTVTGACEDLDSECSACCSADKTNAEYQGGLGTRQDAFGFLCDIDTACPTQDPSAAPSKMPSQTPSKTPTKTPTEMPSETPSESPSNDPSMSPSKNPSASPSETPSKNPTQPPTQKPTKNPLRAGETHNPTTIPTSDPTNAPSKDPSRSPSNYPSETPSKNPSGSPSKNPSKYPSGSPSKNPSETPTQKPTNNPLGAGETHAPTDAPVDDSQGGSDNNPDESQMISIIIPILCIMIVAIVTY